MRVVVLVCGQMRTADVCHESIRACYPDATFVVHAVADEDSDKAFLFRPAVTVIEPQREMPERTEYSWQMARNCHGVQGVLKQLWGLKRVWQVFESSGIEADVIVRCRPDLFFYVPTEPPAADCLHVPTFHNWGGLCDRFAWGPTDVMRKYFTRGDRLDEYIDAKGQFHPETFLAWAMRGCEVRRTRCVFASVRKTGRRDFPVWHRHWGDEPL